jgi:transcriptional regulator with XRE-family HTH domain
MEHAGRHIPNKIRRYRRMRGYNQAQVAALFGHCNTSTISGWEKGYCFPSVSNLFQLCILYRVHPHELYGHIYSELREKMLQRLSKQKQKPRK